MNQETLFSFIKLAHIEVLGLTRLPNEYCGDHSDCDICKDNPWWLIKTEIGEIKIGWRKRVIEIDWSKTGYKIDPNKITDSDVTKNENYIHAWGYSQALQFWDRVIHLLRCARRDTKRAAEGESV